MSHLSLAKQTEIIGGLVEGNSIRAMERTSGAHRDTIMRLALRVGRGCAKIMDEEMRDLTCTNLQADEIWAYVGRKQNQVKPGPGSREVGDQWTFVALDADTKLVPCFLVGKRTPANAVTFMNDLSQCLSNRVQLSTDGLGAYMRPRSHGQVRRCARRYARIAPVQGSFCAADGLRRHLGLILINALTAIGRLAALSGAPRGPEEGRPPAWALRNAGPPSG